jgi:hypothetical protein
MVRILICTPANGGVLASEYILLYSEHRDRAVAQAVSRCLPTAAVRIHVRTEHVVFVVDKWY